MNKNKQKRLPCKVPQTTAWPDTNFLLSIVQNQPNGLEWVLNTHIQMRAAVYRSYQWNIQDARISFYPYAMHDLTPNLFDQCPFVDKYTIPREITNSLYESFAGFVQYAIDREFYISLYVDQFFRQDIGVEGYHHPIYIYGYDNEKRVIYAYDNFENGKYSSKEIPYEVLQRAYDLIQPAQWESAVFLYKLKHHSYQFVSSFVCEQLEDYLYPNQGICYFDKMMCPEKVHDGEDYYNAVYFGIDCYEFLKRYLRILIENPLPNVMYDMRSFCTLVDHKELMLERYQYMSRNGYIGENDSLSMALQKQLDSARIMLNLFLKYMVKPKEQILMQILPRLDEFVSDEKSSLQKMIAMIKAANEMD